MNGTGFFGKLPASGDFVSRGLAPGIRPLLDRWMTAHLAARARRPETWPDGGLRTVLSAPTSGVLVLALVPSRDRSGREFPLAACSTCDAVDPGAVDTWSAQAIPLLNSAVADNWQPESLWSALAEIATPPEVEGEAISPPLVWTSEISPQDPIQALAAIFPDPA